MQRKSKYKQIKIQKVVNANVSIAGTLRGLGLSSRGGHKSLRDLIAKCDTSHFTGQGWLKGRTYFKKTNKELFVRNSGTSSYAIREALFKRKLKRKKCEKCGIVHWNGLPAPLELHHINGIKTDHRLKNLKILCPNCHAQTPTYKIKNTKKAGMAKR